MQTGRILRVINNINVRGVIERVSRTDNLDLMETINAISTLLKVHNCVIIPNFGAFVASNKSAKISGETITPPSKSILFNSSILFNDGILTSYIALKCGITYQEALNIVIAETNSLNKKVSSKESIILNGVGTISADSYGKKIFSPLLSNNLNLDSFGLNPLQITSLPSLKIETKEPREETHIKRFSLLPSKRNLSRIAIIVPLAFALSTISLKVNKTSHNYTANSIDLEAISIKSIDSGIHIAESPTKVESSAKIDEVIDYKYGVVAGVFRNKDNAIKQQTKLISLGYSSSSIDTLKRGSLRVFYSQFTNMEEASLLKERLKQQSGNKGVWIAKLQ